MKIFRNNTGNLTKQTIIRRYKILFKAHSILFSLLLTLPAAASSWQGNFQRPESYDVVPVVELKAGEEDRTLQATTRFPNGCYSPLNSFKEVEGKDLTLYNVATYPKDAACPRIVEYNRVVFNINTLEPGDYRIVDGDDGAVLGELKKTQSNVKIESNLE